MQQVTALVATELFKAAKFGEKIFFAESLKVCSLLSLWSYVNANTIRSMTLIECTQHR